jgi:peptidyl-prolyl cis-trans isomerase SurA
MKCTTKTTCLRYAPKLLSFFLCTILWASAQITHGELIDRVVAEVNDEVITLSEVEEEGQAFFRKIAMEAPPQDRDEAIARARVDVLDGLIDKTLIRQEAEKQQISVTEEEIDGAFQQILATADVNRDTFLEQLYASGLDEITYRSNLQSQILQNKLISRDIRSKIIITEDRILDYYDAQYTRRVDEGSYYLLQIGVSWGETQATESSTTAIEEKKSNARKQVESVHKLARSGQDFRELARKFSDLPSAADGGDIGVFQEDDMASYMKNAVISLRPGEISPIIETPVGYQFFKLLSTREGGIVIQAPYDTVKDEIRQKLFQEAMQSEFKNWINGIKERAYIRKL